MNRWLVCLINLDKLARMTSQGLLTLDEAATYLGVAKITLRRWTRDGYLACVRIGKRGDRRFRRQDLDAYIKRRRAWGGATLSEDRGGDEPRKR